MRISDYVANYILELLEENEDESVEIKRNELANTIGCVPSQINYVITSRFYSRTRIFSGKSARRRRIYSHYAYELQQRILYYAYYA